MQRENIITSTLRIPESHYDKIKAHADYIGDSVNGTMLTLMYLGLAE